MRIFTDHKLIDEKLDYSEQADSFEPWLMLGRISSPKYAQRQPSLERHHQFPDRAALVQLTAGHQSVSDSPPTRVKLAEIATSDVVWTHSIIAAMEIKHT